jgi:hypothetical protein
MIIDSQIHSATGDEQVAAMPDRPRRAVNPDDPAVLDTIAEW